MPEALRQVPSPKQMPPTAAAKSVGLLQSCPTLCDPTDGSPPGFPVPGILQGRTPEWVAVSFSGPELARATEGAACPPAPNVCR